MIRSVIAVISGYAVIAVAILALFALGFRDPTRVAGTGLLVFSLAYALVFAVLGGFVTTRIAAHSHLHHTIWLAVLAAVLGVVSLAVSSGQEPLWYPLANILVVAAGVVLGGVWGERVPVRGGP